MAANNFADASIIDTSSLPQSIKSLNLSSSQLTELPKTLKRLVKLADLDVSNNPFRQGQAVDTSRLPSSLTSLSFDYCNLTTIPSGLSALTKLKQLSLRELALADIFPSKQLPPLANLVLDGSKVTGISAFSESVEASLKTISCRDCSSLQSLPELPATLTTLDISSVKMRVIKKGTLPSSLRTLRVTNSNALKVSPVDLAAMKNLSELSLAHSSISTFAWSANLQTLTDLSLRDNFLSSFVAEMPQTKKLILRGNQLKTFNVTQATMLTHLDLGDNDLEEIPASVFSLSGLRSLQLDGNPIEHFRPTDEQLVFLNKLSYLSMDQDQFSVNCSSISRLKQFKLCLGASSSSQDNTPSTDDATNSQETKKSSAVGIISLILLVVIVLVVAGRVFWVRRKRRHRRTLMLNEKEAFEAARARENATTITHWDPDALEAVRVEMDSLIKSRRVAYGTHAEVWLAIHESRRVALKHLRTEEATTETVEQFNAEVTLVASLCHVHIIAFVGVAWTEPTDVTLITEFAENGDLRTHLEQHVRPTDGVWDSHKTGIALGIAEGIEYLHSLSRPVVHGDLTSWNVLLDGEFVPKISGFRVAHHLHFGKKASVDQKRMQLLAENSHGARWLAPEILNGSEHDISVDVFSLGAILSELDTHKIPYGDIQDENGEPLGDNAVKTRLADGTLRLSLLPTCPRTVSELALRCSAFEPSERPSIMVVVAILREIHQNAIRESEDPEYITI